MLSDEIKKLEEENAKLKFDLEIARGANKVLKQRLEKYKNYCEMVLPDKVYTHKARKNTTVKFKDGSCMTVKRKQGEKDCIETAIAYCILKQLITREELNKLIKNKEEH